MSLSVLNCGEGDTKLTFDPSKPAERKRAAKIVTDMLRNGYAILIAAGKSAEGRDVYERIDAFDENTCEYIIMGGPDEQIDIGAPAKRRTSKKKVASRRVQAHGTRAVSVARTAGG